MIPVLFYVGKRSPYPYSTRWLDEFDNPELAGKVYGGAYPLVDVTVVPDDEIMNHRSMAALTLLQKYIGLVPKQTGSGGKVRLLGISKRGDKYLRTLFIHGARAASLLAKEPGPWITELKKRRPTGVAMANKLARTLWAIAAHNRKYDKNHVSIKPV